MCALQIFCIIIIIIIIIRPITDDNQSILIETSSCNLQFFSELITTQLRVFYLVSLQVVFTLLRPITIAKKVYRKPIIHAFQKLDNTHLEKKL